MVAKKLRIFCAVHNFNWERDNLIQTLKDIGHDIVWFDWGDHGYDQYSKDWKTGKKVEMNQLMIECFNNEHHIKKFDLFFGYLSDPVVFPETIQEIKATGVYCMNFGCNNVGSFARANMNIGKSFDVTWTVDKSSIPDFQFHNMPVIYAPLAINPMFYTPPENIPELENFFDAGFIGQLYGYRTKLMELIAKNGFSINISSGVSYEAMRFLTSITALNIIPRGIGNADITNMKMKQIRLKDFEIPALGGVALSENIPELENLFDIGLECLVFDPNNLETLVEVLLRYSKDEASLNKIAEAGRKRVLIEHTWENRFNKIFQEVGLLS